MYGGTRPGLRPRQRQQGLSPRVRGNRGRGRHGRNANGSIPACTGEPLPTARIVQSSGVYPRVYGGTLLIPTVTAEILGLSPRVRGNLTGEGCLDLDDRSIPACTGEPCPAAVSHRIEKVYPRVYGGTPPRRRVLSPAAGLSPRVRGNLQQRASGRVEDRSIPACTGEPAGVRLANGIGEVYPRVYGGTGERS